MWKKNCKTIKNVSETRAPYKETNRGIERGEEGMVGMRREPQGEQENINRKGTSECTWKKETGLRWRRAGTGWGEETLLKSTGLKSVGDKR